MTKIYNKMAIKNETLKYYFFQWQWTLSLLRRFFPFLYHRQDFYLTCLWERWRGVLSETGTPYCLWERWRGFYHKQELLICEKDGRALIRNRNSLSVRKMLGGLIRNRNSLSVRKMAESLIRNRNSLSFVRNFGIV